MKKIIFALNYIMDRNDMGSLNDTRPSINNGISSYSIESESSGIFDGLSSIPVSTILIVIVVFLLLGFNVFYFMAKGTDELFELTAPIIEKIMEILDSVFDLFGNISKFVISFLAKGSTSIINTSASEVNNAITSVQNIGEDPKSNTSKLSINHEPVVIPEKNATNKVQEKQPINTLNQALDSAASNSASDYSADESSSSIQNSKGKGGWCFIGEDRGVRTCAEVGKDDTCMSGDIFPSNQICVNPKLRA